MPGNAELIGTTADGRQLVRLACAIAADAFARSQGDGDDESADGSAWLQILPAGPLVVARDGRAFQVTSAEAVAANSEKPILLDWEHDSERWDGSTKAAGWGLDLEVRDTGVWMRCEFTEDGAKDVKSKSYRYLSPVLVIDGETRDVEQIVSVALTNKPALRMQEIGQFRAQFSRFGLVADQQEQSSMDKQKRALLCAAFSLAESASDDDILAAQRAQAAQVAASASTRDLFTAQSADLTSARSETETLRAETVSLKAQLAEATKVSAQAQLERDVDACFAENVKKLPPASAKAQREFCLKSRENFEAFKSFLPTMPEIGNVAPPSAAPGETTQAGTTTVSLSAKPAITDKERAKFRAKGWSDERINASLGHLVEQKARYVGADDEED